MQGNWFTNFVLIGLILLLSITCLKCGIDHLVRADEKYNMGVEAYHAGNTEEALSLFKSAVSHNEQHTLALYNIGVIYYDRGIYPLAKVYFQRASEAEEETSDAMAQKISNSYNQISSVENQFFQQPLPELALQYCKTSDRELKEFLSNWFINNVSQQNTITAFNTIVNGTHPQSTINEAASFLQNNFNVSSNIQPNQIASSPPPVQPRYQEPVARTHPLPQSGYTPGNPKFVPPRFIYAIVIGIGNYEDSSFPQLPYAVNDARAINHMLTSQNFGVPRENIEILLNEEATLTNIYVALDDIKRKANSTSNCIFFYFSGHGAPITEGSGEMTDGVLIPHDANIRSLQRTGISIAELNDEISSTNASAIVMLDACFSGQGRSEGVLPPGVRGLTVTPRSDIIQNSSADKIFITGAGPNQFSNDYSQEQHGLFTYYVLQGLMDKRADDNYDGLVEIGELYNYLSVIVPRESTSLSGLQEPQIYGNGKNIVINQ